MKTHVEGYQIASFCSVHFVFLYASCAPSLTLVSFLFFYLFIPPQPILDEIALETSNKITEGRPIEEINKKTSSIKIAKIDATKNKIISGQFSVTSFPTIKYVNNGILGEYTGIRTKDSFLSFIRIMRGDHLIEIKSHSDLRTLQLSNLLSDTSNSNIVFLLTIYRTKENEGNLLEEGQNLLKSTTNENEIDIEKIFGQIAKSYQGKAVFTILHENQNIGDIDKISKKNTDNYNKNVFLQDRNIISGTYSISKREINRPPIYFKNKKNVKKIQNYDINDDANKKEKTNINENNGNNDEIMLSQTLESFIISHNRHLISKLSQHNFRDLMHLKKIMVIAVVHNISTILVNEKNYNSLNNENINHNENLKIKDIGNNYNIKNNGEIMDSVIVDSENILKFFEKNILEKLYSVDNFNKNTNEDGNNINSRDDTLNLNSTLNLNDCIFGYLDSKKWQKFLKQFGVKSSSILFLDFRSSTLYYYQKSLKKYSKSRNEIIGIEDKIFSSSNLQENQKNKNILDININLILNDLYNDKLKFKKLKTSQDILFEIAVLIKNKFSTFHPFSVLFCFIIILIFCSFFTLSPSIRVKKD